MMCTGAETARLLFAGLPMRGTAVATGSTSKGRARVMGRHGMTKTLLCETTSEGTATALGKGDPDCVARIGSGAEAGSAPESAASAMCLRRDEKAANRGQRNKTATRAQVLCCPKRGPMREKALRR